MIKILLSGITGKMGHEIINEVNNCNDLEVVAGLCKTENDNKIIYNDVDAIKEDIDVIIDFSSHDFTLDVLDYAKRKNIPIVIGTTGFNNLELEKINDCANYIPIFKSSNMSYEINLINNILFNYAKKLKDCDIEIIEEHHRNKIDSPSGTALMLANTINNSLNDSFDYVYGRGLSKQKRKNNEIGIHSIRGGTVMGKHTILFLGDNESIELTHNVTSRSVFAKGALKAAKYILHQGKGIYDMNDLIEQGEKYE